MNDDTVPSWEELTAKTREEVIERARNERIAEEQLGELPSGRSLPASSSTRLDDRTDDQYSGEWSSVTSKGSEQ